MTSDEHLGVIQTNYPRIWEAYHEVSALAKQRAGLLEQVSAFTKERDILLQQQKKLQDLIAMLQQESSKQSAGSLLQQQQETTTLRLQLDDARRIAQEKEGEVDKLRAQLRHLTNCMP